MILGEKWTEMFLHLRIPDPIPHSVKLKLKEPCDDLKRVFTASKNKVVMWRVNVCQGKGFQCNKCLLRLLWK